MRTGKYHKGKLWASKNEECREGRPWLDVACGKTDYRMMCEREMGTGEPAR